MRRARARCSTIRCVKDLVAFCLATHRLTRLATTDVIFKKPRDRVLEKYPPTEDSWSYLFTCPWCASIWLGGALALFRLVVPRKLAEAVIYSLAASSITGALEERL